jgi:hypothetical protein
VQSIPRRSVTCGPQSVSSSTTFIVDKLTEGKLLMLSKKLSGLAAGVVAAAALSVVTTEPAFADCGDPGQPACTGPVPTVDQVVAIMAELTDPNIPAATKTDIVVPGFSPDEAGTIDDHLNRMRKQLPINFFVTNIQPAPNNLAGATVETQRTYPRPLVLVGQGGHWLITHDSAVAELDLFWRVANRIY